jgi:acetoin utilization deacetylase AcuC-like enzyme
MPPTAFVSHPDCARHDTGWKHADHQGRLPALVRAVYADMLTLHGHLTEVEARPASETDLLLVHTPELIEQVRQASSWAAAENRLRMLEGEVVVSGASWEAALAAVGCALTGVDVVASGAARNAFCAARPPGHAASAGQVGGFSIFNNVAIATRHLRRRHGIERVLVVCWGGSTPAIGSILAADEGVRVLSVGEAAAPGEGHRVLSVVLPAGSDGALLAGAAEAALADLLTGFDPQFVMLAAGFDVLAADPAGALGLEPRDIHALTGYLRQVADLHCDGRLVSVLEGGYDARALGLAAVQHLRALAGLELA